MTAYFPALYYQALREERSMQNYYEFDVFIDGERQEHGSIRIAKAPSFADALKQAAKIAPANAVLMLMKRPDPQPTLQELTSLTWPDGRPKIAPVQGYPQGIPWSLHLKAYEQYAKKYSGQLALIDLEHRGCRGGFSTGELDMFVPGWRNEVEELRKLQAFRKEVTLIESELRRGMSHIFPLVDPVIKDSVDTAFRVIADRLKEAVDKAG